MATARVDLGCARGEAVTFNGTHQTSATNSSVVDITGWTIRAIVKDSAGNTLFDKLCSILSGAAGTYAFSLTHTETTIPVGTYGFDIWRVDNGSERQLGYGSFVITPEVRYP